MAVQVELHWAEKNNQTYDQKTFVKLRKEANPNEQSNYWRERVRNVLGRAVTELCIAGFTLLSAFVVGFQVEEAAQHATDASFQPNLVFTLINHALTCCFTSELLLRIYAFRKAFIWSEDFQWNLLDLIIVIASLVELTLDVLQYVSLDTGRARPAWQGLKSSLVNHSSSGAWNVLAHGHEGHRVTTAISRWLTRFQPGCP
eukprot:Skav235929  [mRNA]  locus=scaffold1246:75428:85502:- [translate_table: standard]